MNYYVLLHSCGGSQLEACDARKVFGPWSDLNIAQDKEQQLWDDVASLGLDMAVTILEAREDQFVDIPANPTASDFGYDYDEDD